MGFKLEYRIGNRKVSKREWERHMFEEAPQQLAEDALGGKLNNIRCPSMGSGRGSRIGARQARACGST